MKRLAVALTVLAMLAPLSHAAGQTLNARRTAMGGVVLPGSGPGGEAGNVAYRAVPAGPGSHYGIPLPIGFIPLIADPPTFDPDKPDFNVYRLINLLYNPPWNLQLVSPEPPSSDIVVDIGKDRLSVQLGEIGEIFPESDSRLAGVVHSPALGFGMRNFFAGVSAQGEYDNVLSMNPALYGALVKGESFQTLTDYRLTDNAHGQAAAALQLGWAARLAGGSADDKDAPDGFYAGTRVKVLRGIAYGEAHNEVSFMTSDTLFSDSPVDLGYAATLREAGPSGGGMGRAFDFGVVWIGGPLELGLGVNDIASRIDWRVEESVAVKDSTTGDYIRQVIAEDAPFQSEFPVSGTVNAGMRLGRFLVAGDVVRSNSHTTTHLGAETWLGIVGIRAGSQLDPNLRLQYSGGVGLKLGPVGVDLALATNSRNLSRERGLELGAGIALYH